MAPPVIQCTTCSSATITGNLQRYGTDWEGAIVRQMKSYSDVRPRWARRNGSGRSRRWRLLFRRWRVLMIGPIKLILNLRRICDLLVYVGPPWPTADERMGREDA